MRNFCQAFGFAFRNQNKIGYRIKNGGIVFCFFFLKRQQYICCTVQLQQNLYNVFNKLKIIFAFNVFSAFPSHLIIVKICVSIYKIFFLRYLSIQFINHFIKRLINWKKFWKKFIKMFFFFPQQQLFFTFTTILKIKCCFNSQLYCFRNFCNLILLNFEIFLQKENIIYCLYQNT